MNRYLLRIVHGENTYVLAFSSPSKRADAMVTLAHCDVTVSVEDLV